MRSKIVNLVRHDGFITMFAFKTDFVANIHKYNNLINTLADNHIDYLVSIKEIPYMYYEYQSIEFHSGAPGEIQPSSSSVHSASRWTTEVIK